MTQTHSRRLILLRHRALGLATTTLALTLAGCGSSPTGPNAPSLRPTVPPPKTRTVDVTDDFHGTAVADPYRWLEDANDPDVKAWITAQNATTNSYLAQIPARERLRTRLAELWNHERRSPPSREGARWFHWRNDGLQNQPILYVADDDTSAGTPLLDPNTLSADGTTSVSGLAFTKDGSKLAYAVSEKGSDWRTWRVLDVATGTPLPDSRPWSKFAPAAWLADGSAFFYQRYPEPKEGTAYQAATRIPQLCLHVLGTDPTTDVVVYERPDQPKFAYAPEVTDDGRYLVLRVSEGTERKNRIAIAEIASFAPDTTIAPESRIKPLLWDFDAGYEFLANDGTTFWFATDADAPRGRIVAIDITNPAREHWQTIVPERKDTLADTLFAGGRFVCSYMRDAKHVVVVFDRDGKQTAEITLPDLGTVGQLTGKPASDVVHFSFTTFTKPGSILRHDLATNTTTTIAEPKVAFDASQFQTRQVFFQSKDGTRIPMFVVHRRDLRLDGSRPTLLYGYGGFRIPILPAFRPTTIAWLEDGGVYASVNLRGGAEYGAAWHDAGRLKNKQNVFDDFVAAAEYLTRNGFTRPDRLAVQGGSNGGLLVGAMLTQRPDLIGAAIPEVGVLDMLRYHLFTIGWAWASDYGRADDPEMFATLYGYSPLHRIRPGTSYPATFVMTGDHDDRVVPGHSFKFAAALQNAQGGDAPILLRVETSAGHGAGKPTSKLIDEAADRFAFLHGALRIDD
jgi:prolyl oligopeptidase